MHQGDEDVRTYRQLPLEADPPLHTALRAFLVPFFSKGSLAPYQPLIAADARALVAPLRDGELEMVRGVGLPLVVRTIARLLDRPADVAEWESWGPSVWGDHDGRRDGAPLEAVVGRLLRERGATLAVAESCTGGILGERITSVPGSSDYFLGGFLVYSNQMKTELLGVDAALITAHTAVSEETAKAMAAGALARTGSTYAVSITGEAGPESNTGAPVGTVIIGLAAKGMEPRAERFILFGGREGIRARAAQWALDQIRRLLSTPA